MESMTQHEIRRFFRCSIEGGGAMNVRELKVALPNLLSGALIGFAYSPWYAVAIGGLIWASGWCLYLWSFSARTAQIAAMRGAPNLWFGSAAASVWIVAWLTNFAVVLAAGTLIYFITQKF
jgi:hypothetical protein